MTALLRTLPETAHWIAEKIRSDENLRPSATLMPCLMFCFGYRKQDNEGKCFESYSSGFFDIGWYPDETVRNSNFVEVQVLGMRIWIPPNLFELLNGKILTVQQVEVGFPIPSEKTKTILQAVPDEIGASSSLASGQS